MVTMSNKTRNDYREVQLPSPIATISSRSISCAHGVDASDWYGLYNRWSSCTFRQDAHFWLSRFEEVVSRKLSLDMPTILLQLDALVVCHLNEEGLFHHVVDSNLVVPFAQVPPFLRKKGAMMIALMHSRILLTPKSTDHIIDAAEQLADVSDIKQLCCLLDLPVSDRKELNTALLCSRVPSSVENFWELNGMNNEDVDIVTFLETIATMSAASCEPRRFVSIFREAMDLNDLQMPAMEIVIFSAIPCEDLLSKILEGLKNQFQRNKSRSVFLLQRVLDEYFDAIKLLDIELILNIIPLIVHHLRVLYNSLNGGDVCLVDSTLKLLVTIAERGAPIIQVHMLGAGVSKTLNAILLDPDCVGEVQQLAQRYDYLLKESLVQLRLNLRAERSSSNPEHACCEITSVSNANTVKDVTDFDSPHAKSFVTREDSEREFTSTPLAHSLPHASLCDSVPRQLACSEVDGPPLHEDMMPQEPPHAEADLIPFPQRPPERSRDASTHKADSSNLHSTNRGTVLALSSLVVLLTALLYLLLAVPTPSLSPFLP